MCRPIALHYSPLDALESAVVTDTAERIELFALAANDVAEAGKVETLTTQVGDDASVDTTIVPQG